MNDSGKSQEGLQDYMDLLLGPGDDLFGQAPSDDTPEPASAAPSKMSVLSSQVEQQADAALALQQQTQTKTPEDTREFQTPDAQQAQREQQQKLEQALVRERVQQLALRTQQVHQQAKAERQKQQQSEAAVKVATKPALAPEKAESLARARAKVREKIRQRQEQKLLASQQKAKQALAQKSTAKQAEKQIASSPELKPQQLDKQVIAEQLTQAVESQVAESQMAQTEIELNQASVNNRPVWAQEDFDCLFFKVSGLTLAVPLVELGSIYPLTDELTPMFAQTDWFIGLLPVDGQNLKTVNTAKVVIPERYSEDWLEQIRYVISIHGYDWGLAVDNVEQAVTINPDNVKWRSSRSKRPWLAGTIVDHMCALVDLNSLANVLDHPEQMRH